MSIEKYLEFSSNLRFCLTYKTDNPQNIYHMFLAGFAYRLYLRQSVT